jgi:hypothetical protein
MLTGKLRVYLSYLGSNSWPTLSRRCLKDEDIVYLSNKLLKDPRNLEGYVTLNESGQMSVRESFSQQKAVHFKPDPVNIFYDRLKSSEIDMLQVEKPKAKPKPRKKRAKKNEDDCEVSEEFVTKKRQRKKAPDLTMKVQEAQEYFAEDQQKARHKVCAFSYSHAE